MSTLFRVGASLTIDPQTEALSLNEATPLLVQAFHERERAFEKIRLVGADDVAETARLWVRGIYNMRDALNSSPVSEENWERLVAAANEGRTAFYRAARRDLGVTETGLT